MRWLGRLFRGTDQDQGPVDIDLLLKTCQSDPGQVGVVLRRLERERSRLFRQQKNLNKRMSRFSSAHVRDIGRSGPQFGPLQLQADMQMRDDAGQNYNLSLQESDLEERIREVTHAIASMRVLRERTSLPG
ncbi:MAG TPA: hypothetical protein VNZ58_03260 [Thermomicrobiales bacterium]|nr:hypothetical protein [Thermomicrobiales bacterium]